ncbi:glycosyltransferase family 4 protein [Flavobacterium gelatinilyticum]|uniref:glycosyltransferase family 4 protein n=1 Tax=Flavobacterium gelatinilyticum TaxID=3003260 RepID=UPI00248114DC|nr:glycosyltransferase family 4 protein [Flavobacterium gelatinilyticum]
MAKKILHISERGEGGGGESVFRETVVLFQELDLINTHYTACKQSNKLPFKVDFDFKEKEQLADFIYSFSNKRKMDLMLKEIEPDIIHLHHYGNLSPSILHSLHNYKKRRDNIRIIQTVHTFQYSCSHQAAYDYNKTKRCLDCASVHFKTKIFYRKCSRAGFVHSIAKGFNSLITHYYYKKEIIDTIVVPSNFIKEAILLNKFYSDKKIVEINNPIFENLEKKVKFHKENNIVYFGRLSEEKNIKLLITAFSLFASKDIENYKLLIIGDGSEKKELQQYVNEKKILDKVIFFPFMTQRELAKYLETSKISIMTSKCFENAPMMMIESFNYNIIPIAANHGGMREMVLKLNFGLLFESEDEYSLVDQITKAVNDYEKLINEKPKLEAKIRDLFSKSKYFTELSNLYSYR